MIMFRSEIDEIYEIAHLQTGSHQASFYLEYSSSIWIVFLFIVSLDTIFQRYVFVSFLLKYLESFLLLYAFTFSFSTSGLGGLNRID